MIESHQISCCISKLREIQFSLVRPQSIIATQQVSVSLSARATHATSAPFLCSQVLYTFLYRNKEAAVITDDLLRIQYVNGSAERLFDARIVSILTFCSPLVGRAVTVAFRFRRKRC